jgi:hypothetical protein
MSGEHQQEVIRLREELRIATSELQQHRRVYRQKVDEMSAEVVDSNPYRYVVVFVVCH